MINWRQAMQSNQEGAVVTPPLPGWRCRQCRALLLRGILGPRSSIEVRCRRCGTVNVLDTHDVPEEYHRL